MAGKALKKLKIRKNIQGKLLFTFACGFDVNCTNKIISRTSTVPTQNHSTNSSDASQRVYNALQIHVMPL